MIPIFHYLDKSWPPVYIPCNHGRMLSSDYSWTTTKKTKQTRIFGEDDFKFFIFICIFIFCLAGLVLLVTGIFIKSDLEDFEIFAGGDYRAISTFITIVGAFILGVSCLGIYGVFNDINIVIYTYTFFLFLMITAEFAASVSALTLQAGISDKVYNHMKMGQEMYNKQEQEEMSKAWDTVQVKMKCCGMDNFTDWSELQPDIPASCYDPETGNTMFMTGCYDPVLKRIANNITILTGGP